MRKLVGAIVCVKCRTTSAGTGVAGSATTGVGVSASSQSGTALRVDGPAAFDGVTTFVRSGILTIQAGQKSATQIGVALEAASLVLAVAQQTGPRFVTAAVPHVAASSFTVYLNKAAVTDTLFGWFVVI